MKKSLLTSIVIVAIMVATSFSVLVVMESPSEQPQKARISAYTPHNSISINGNSGFTNASGVVRGSGTASDPYIIEGWEIKPTGFDGIAVEDANAYFIIRNCYIHIVGGWSNCGIWLAGCSNGSILNNICRQDANGINLIDSHDNEISGNDFSFNIFNGIHLENSCINNSIMNNNCSSNAGNAGIWIEDSSSGNIILNNTCTDNGGTGISLLDSSGNSVGRNTCNSNGRGLGGENLTGNSIHNNTCSNNLNDGIWTWYSSDNGIFNNVCNANGLNGTTLMYARNSSVINNHCTGNAYSGITVDSSDNNKFTDNNCSSNDYGIFCASYTFHGSSINDVSNNSFFNNVYQGIKIINSQSQKNRIWNNTFHHNNGAGDTYDPAHIQAYDKANNHWNSSISGCGNYWSDWQTPDDVPPGYIVDNPYNIDGSGGAKDYFPRIRFAISELGPLSVMITAPTSNPDISTGWHMIYLRGNASDDVKVTSVTWSNSLGGSGVAYMTPQLGAANVSWQSRGNVMLYDGVNVITVTAYDNEGDSTTDTLNVTYNTGPSVTITAPTSNPTMMTGWHMINLRGTASDDFKVVSVSWTNSLGGSGVAYCTPQGGPSVNWQSRGNVMLYSGGNVITVTAYDNTGKTATDVLTMTYTGP